MDKIFDAQQYGKEFWCDNCGNRFTEFFPKGQRASQGECPKCGCYPKELGVPWHY